jgi:APA family basic amino acid/polyamine antiporter
LLALIAGVGRTSLAMARNGDLPRLLASVDPVRRVPARAELAIGGAVCVLVLTTDLRGAIGFSSFGVLTYYAIANAAAYTQPPQRRRWPRTLNVLGVLACAALAVTLPLGAVVAGIAVLGLGLAGRLALRRKPAAASLARTPGRGGN